MQLTEHFSDAELGVAGCDERLQGNARFLCTEILETVRDHFGPILVHDGYRDPAHNQRVGGKPTSFHLYENGRAAADIGAALASCGDVFDWIREKSGLPFDKVILEFSPDGAAACVHVQVDVLNAPRRNAYIGPTGAGTDYEPVPVDGKPFGGIPG